MTKVDREILDRIEKEDWRREHPGWIPDAILHTLFCIMIVTIMLLIFVWSNAMQVQEVEAAVFHKEEQKILYVEKLDSSSIKRDEFPPEAIEVNTSSSSDAESEIETPGQDSSVVSEEEQWESLGVWKLTAYCPLECCNGKGRAWKTASGIPMVIGETVATAKLPYGTRLKVNGKIYTVTDRGTPYGTLDILHESDAACYRFGVKHAEVFIKK